MTRVAEIGPNRLIVLDHRIVARKRLAFERTARQTGNGNDLCICIDAHAVIRTSELTVVHFADRERRAAMRTAVFNGVHRAVLIAPEHERFAAALHAERRLTNFR
jgi:hypothetical protein